MINERAIFNSLNFHSNRDVRIHIMRIAVVTFLHYNKGYSRRDIANAICRRHYIVNNWLYAARDYEGNETYQATLEALTKSKVELIPKYETTVNNFKEIKIHLYINNKEYKYKLK